jgi:magnesium-transporting ATPase (P-type)
MIRNIGVCSAMACSNIICTDYSNIMTKGEMKISSFYLEDRIIDEFSKTKFKDISEDSYEFFCEAISINSSSYFSEKATNNNKDNVNEIFQTKRFFGDSIDSALLSYLKSIRVDYMKYRNNIDRQVIDRSNYEISKKIQYCVINMADKVDYVRVYVRGSPCVLLKKIKNLISNDAQLSEINFEKYHELKDICKETMCIGLIPVLICFRDINKEHYYSHKKLFLREDEETYEKYLLKDLTLISIIRLQEEIKPNMDELVNEIQSYGINIKLVTSYEKEFACHIADKLGILNESKTEINQNEEEKELSNSVKVDKMSKNKQEKTLNDQVNIDNKFNLNPPSNNKEKLRRNFTEKKYKTLTDYNSILEKLNTNKNVLDTTHDIRKFIDPEVFRIFSKHSNNIDININDYLKLSQLIEKSRIISRAGEIDKFISIALLREKGGIVINLGEGVNDALAMSNSNISISMSPNSTDICREMADIIIMDGNFTSICSLIINSRNLFVTIRKFLQFYLTAIFVLLITVFFCTIINFNIYPSQVLWFNLVVNTFGPFAFSMEQPRKNSLSRKRFSEDIKIINNNMIVFILIESVIQCSILSLIIIYGDCIFNVESDVGISYKYWGPDNGQHTTILLSVMIFLQVFSAFVARNLEKKVNVFKDIKYNKFFPLVQLIIVLLHMILISQGSSYIKVRMISYLNLIKCVLISSIILLTPFVLKFFINEEKDVIKQEKVHQKLLNETVKRKKSDYGLKII